MDFPTTPTVGTTVNNGTSTWVWTGKQWNMGTPIPATAALGVGWVQILKVWTVVAVNDPAKVWSTVLR